MLKRLLWLAFFCAAFLLLLGLMVDHSATLSAEPRLMQGQGSLPVLGGLPKEEPQARENARETKVGVTLGAEPAQVRRHLERSFTRPYRLAKFQAFHFSSEAG